MESFPSTLTSKWMSWREKEREKGREGRVRQREGDGRERGGERGRERGGREREKLVK